MVATAHTPSLAARLARGDVVYCGWSSLADPLAAEAIARSGFDAVCLDMQHGFHDYASLREGLTGIAAAGGVSVIRVPFGGIPDIGRVLDLGFEAVICPMVNSDADARDFAQAMKFPPIGMRSWGPQRAMMLLGRDMDSYLQSANRDVVAFAMIETRDAIDRLDTILSTDGIDAVFVGPSDLSISLSNGANVDADSDEVTQAMRSIAERARAAGKIAGAFSSGKDAAERYVEMGYQFIATGPDLILLRSAAEALINGLRKRPAN